MDDCFILPGVKKCVWSVIGVVAVSGQALAGQALAGQAKAAEQRPIGLTGSGEALLADAAGRPSLDATGSGGWDNGFKIQSADGNYSLRLSGEMQFRYVSTFQDHAPNGAKDTALGFESTRTRLGFGGHVIDPSVNYFIFYGLTGGNGVLLDAWIEKKFDKLTIRAGQFKLPIWEEWTVSETKEQFVERSVLDARFSQVYSQGVMATWQEDDWRVKVALSDGARSLNDNTLGTQFGVTGRAEYKWAGEWRQRAYYNSFPEDPKFGVVGAAFHYEDGASAASEGSGRPFVDDAKVYQFTADAQVGYGGYGAAIAFIANLEENPGGRDYDQYGVLVQGGYFINEHTELIARYEWGDLDGEAGDRVSAMAMSDETTNDTANVLTLGVNRFFAGHAMKFTADASVVLDELSGAWGASGRGFRADSEGAGPQVVLRSQVQLLF